MPFKESEDFLRYLTMGAAGCAAIARHLASTHRHRVAELERYTMSNKIWQTKVKRLRLPDLMCLDCGLRFEAKAKSALEIKLSHSSTAGRHWDAGLRPQDLVAFIHCRSSSGMSVAAQRPQYFTVKALQAAHSHAKLGPAKSASAGAERDYCWPSSVPKQGGLVWHVEQGLVRATLDNGRNQTYKVADAYPYLQQGDRFVADANFLLGVVEPPGDIGCAGEIWDYGADLDAPDTVDRYAAVKAAGLQRDERCAPRLAAIASVGVEDWRLMLEALGSLARIDPQTWTPRIAQLAHQDAQNNKSLVMEAMFLLAELRTDAASQLLWDFASDHTFATEARAAAVWGLGAVGTNRPELVLPFVADADDDVALHALATIGTLAPTLVERAQAMLRAEPREAAAAATLLARQGGSGAAALIEASQWSGSASHFALYALGQISPDMVREAGSNALPESMQFALTTMWKGNFDNWVQQNHNADALRSLEQQTLRENSEVPVLPTPR